MRIKTLKSEEESLGIVHLKLEDENLVIEGDGIEILINTKASMLGDNLDIYPKTKGIKTKVIFKEKDWAHPQIDLDEVDGIQFYWEE